MENLGLWLGKVWGYGKFEIMVSVSVGLWYVLGYGKFGVMVSLGL